MIKLKIERSSSILRHESYFLPYDNSQDVICARFIDEIFQKKHKLCASKAPKNITLLASNRLFKSDFPIIRVQVKKMNKDERRVYYGFKDERRVYDGFASFGKVRGGMVNKNGTVSRISVEDRLTPYADRRIKRLGWKTVYFSIAI